MTFNHFIYTRLAHSKHYNKLHITCICHSMTAFLMVTINIMTTKKIQHDIVDMS